MKISFIVICYNGGDVIYNCLRSILTIQNLCDFEVIYVDDSSSDSSLKKVEDLASKHNNLVILRNDENKGRAYSRNRGLYRSAGEYICFVDADDFINSLVLSEILPYLSSGNDVIIPGRLDFNLKNKRFFSFTSHTYLFTGLKFIHRPSDYPACYFDNFVTGKFIRRDLLLNNNIFFSTARRNAEDILFSSFIWLHSRNIYFLKNYLFYIYGRGNYKESFGIKKCEDVLINCKEIIKISNENITKNEKIIFINKYILTIFETMRRAEGVIDEGRIVEIFEQHYIDTRAYSSELIYVDSKIKKFARLCSSGKFSEAYQLAIG